MTPERTNAVSVAKDCVQISRPGGSEYRLTRESLQRDPRGSLRVLLSHSWADLDLALDVLDAADELEAVAS